MCVYINLTDGIEYLLQREAIGIFLEDDNLPELSFFRFMQEMLLKYESCSEVMWVCGTNYLENVTSRSRESYFFSKNLSPCGWGTWSNKFLGFYDKELATLDFSKSNQSKIQRRYLVGPIKQLFN